MGGIALRTNSYIGCSCTSELHSCAINDADFDIFLQGFLSPLLKALPAPDREIVWRADFMGDSLSAIECDLGLSARTVATRLKHGRRTLLQLAVLALEPPDAA
tara:strand:- start:1282 stop:1590 length:309 start_codon:yes stop_codon:yes gene_type:complete